MQITKFTRFDQTVIEDHKQKIQHTYLLWIDVEIIANLTNPYKR